MCLAQNLKSFLLNPALQLYGRTAQTEVSQKAAMNGMMGAFSASWEVAVILSFTAAAVMVGHIDDRLTLQSRQGKGPRGIPIATHFLIQSAAALCLAIIVYIMNPKATLNLAVLPSFVLSIPKWMYSALCAFTYVSMVNAVNLTDGLDGLAASCTSLVFSTMAVILAASHGSVAMV